MKKIERIDLEGHKLKREFTLYKIESKKYIKVSKINCVKLKNSIINNKKKIIDKKLVEVLINEKKYREIIGLKI